MLAPRVSNAFVCTRCELQLARRRLPALFPRPSRARFSASVRRHDGADELDAQLDPSPASIKITKEIQQLDRVRKRKGKLMRETSAKLEGIKTLGDDADILVLKEIGKKQEEEPVVETLPTEAVDVPDILASLQEERSALTPEEIRDRLESLRPKTDAAPDEPLYVSLKVFVKLMRDLSNGFSQQQLSKFYSTAKNIQQATDKSVLASLKASAGSAKRPFARTEWQPETTPLSNRLPGADLATMHHRRAKLASKQLLVDRIIRDLWKLVPLEEVETLGEIELSLKPWHVVMLTTGENETVLDKISSARKAKLEIHRQHNVLRITADKTTAEYVANDIEQALENISTKTLHLAPWLDNVEPSKIPQDRMLPALYSTEDLHMVTSSTRVYVHRVENRNQLLLRGLDEDAVNEAERALLRLLPRKENTTRTIDTEGLNDSARLLFTPFDPKSLDHKHREAALGRWMLPVLRQARNEGLKEDLEKGKDLDLAKMSAARRGRVAAMAENFRQSAADEVTRAQKLGPWTAEPRHNLSATFGQVLFPLDETAPRSSIESWKEASPQPVFTSSVSGMTTLFSSTQTQRSSASGTLQFDPLPHKPSLVYEFIPEPAQQRINAGQTLPTLRIEMRTGATETEAIFHKLYLYVHEHLHTVLLPVGAADLQLQKISRLAIGDIHSIKELDEWLSAVIANIASGERISAPDLTIDIPKWTISGQPDDVSGTRPAKYLFSGVRFRHSVSGSFQGTTVSYKTNQSNKLASQGGSLTMHYEQSSRNVQAPANEVDKLAQFLDKCLVFAEHITQTASNTQPIAKMERTKAYQRTKLPKKQGETQLVNIADTTTEQHQEQIRSTNDVHETEAIEMEMENDMVTGENEIRPPAKVDDTVDSSKEVLPQEVEAPTVHQDSVGKSQA